MSRKARLGVVGVGNLGGAVVATMRERGYDVRGYDILPDRSDVESIEELIDCEMIFVTLPTPLHIDNRLFTHFIEEAVSELDVAARGRERVPLIVIRSTLPLATVRQLNARVTSLKGRIVHVPEFARQATMLSDVASEAYVIVGGPETAVDEFTEAYARLVPGIAIHRASSPELVALVKMRRNAEMSVVISFNNEVAMLTKRLRLSYQEATQLHHLDSRMSPCSRVPGPDNTLGYGLSCLFKDARQLLTEMESVQEVPAHVLEAQFLTNAAVRPQQDHLSLVGQAVTPEYAAWAKSHPGTSKGGDRVLCEVTA